MSEVVNALLEFDEYENYSRPPTIVLGQFERVGSTFYLDQLEKTQTVHNEPYKLLIPPEWPISRDYVGALETVDDFFADREIPAAHKHWFRNFFVSLHKPGGQVVKETNLFLALPQFLDLFPKSPIRLLTRNPFGIASSFKRNDLYSRWSYDQTAEVVSAQLKAGKPANFESMVEMAQERENWLEHIVWLMGLNSVLLSRYVDKRAVTDIIRYEEDVIPLSTDETVMNARVQDSIFATNIRKDHDDFESRLSDEEMRTVGTAVEECTNFVTGEFDEADQRLVYQLFSRHIGSERPSTYSPTKRELGKVSIATQAIEVHPIEIVDELASEKERKLVQIDPDQPLLWDLALVTNEQMGNFLQKLVSSGWDPSLNYLLCMDNMPQTRGGRIIYNNELSTFELAEDFKDYPAYWISWLAASLYAYSQGMRLPRYPEWQDAFASLGESAQHPGVNHSYAFDDATPTGKGDITEDFFGNLKIWCQDWEEPEAVNKRTAGISWKQYLHPKFSTASKRPYLTNSRTIGARLVCCSECPRPEPKSLYEVKFVLDTTLELIERTPVKSAEDLSRLNNKLADTLAPDACTHTNPGDV